MFAAFVYYNLLFYWDSMGLFFSVISAGFLQNTSLLFEEKVLFKFFSERKIKIKQGLQIYFTATRTALLVYFYCGTEHAEFMARTIT